MIRAGTIEEAVADSGQWIIIDIGFSEKQATCGVWMQSSERLLTFGTMCSEVTEVIKSSKDAINLVIEAPLSLVFNDSGCPTGRELEKFTDPQGKNKFRYWYVGLGSTVMLAAGHLLRAIYDSKPQCEVRLFEGFVSFKNPDTKSDHLEDVRQMKKVIFEPNEKVGRITLPQEENLTSAYKAWGMDFGIPPIIFVEPKH